MQAGEVILYLKYMSSSIRGKHSFVCCSYIRGNVCINCYVYSTILPLVRLQYGTGALSEMAVQRQLVARILAVSDRREP